MCASWNFSEAVVNTGAVAPTKFRRIEEYPGFRLCLNQPHSNQALHGVAHALAMEPGLLAELPHADPVALFSIRQPVGTDPSPSLAQDHQQ